MPIKVSWDPEGVDTVLVEFEGEWTRQDYWEAVRAANALVESVAVPLRVIIDLSRSVQSLEDVGYQSARSTMMVTPTNVRDVAFVTGKAFNQAFVATFLKLYQSYYQARNTRVFVVDTRAEARARFNE